MCQRVTRERKGDWVAKSRAAGKRLTDWIVEQVERPDAREARDEQAQDD